MVFVQKVIVQFYSCGMCTLVKWELLNKKMFNFMLDKFPNCSISILGNKILFNLTTIQSHLFSWRWGIVVCSQHGPPGIHFIGYLGVCLKASMV